MDNILPEIFFFAGARLHNYGHPLDRKQTFFCSQPYVVVKYTKSVNYDMLIMHTELFAGLNADPKVGQHNVQSQSESFSSVQMM